MAIRQRILAEEIRCYVCGDFGRADDVIDHVVPLSAGGTDDRENLRRMCRDCHRVKVGRESHAARR